MRRSSRSRTSGWKARTVRRELGFAGNHVGRVAGVEGADRDHAHLQRRHVARHDGLQRHHDARGGHHRVDRGLRHRAVAALAAHLDDHAVGARHREARHGDELALGLARHVVHAEHRLAGEELQEAVVEHALGAGQAFFGRLEHQVQVAVEAARRGQVARRGQQHRGVAVVAAGVHLAEHLARPRLAAGLGDRQRVHVGAQADVAVGRAGAQRADHAGAAQAAMHLVAPALQSLGHQVGGGVLFVGELRIRVDLAPDGDHLVFMLADLVERGQGQRCVHGWTSGRWMPECVMPMAGSGRLGFPWSTRPQQAGLHEADQQRSKIAAMPWPPPMHMVTSA